ncbi:hypothetical protein [Tumebacillus avium]|nr:hypothetical protein [Tumebacillus avium]
MRKYVALGLLVCIMVISALTMEVNANAESVPGPPVMGISVQK